MVTLIGLVIIVGCQYSYKCSYYSWLIVVFSYERCSYDATIRSMDHRSRGPAIVSGTERGGFTGRGRRRRRRCWRRRRRGSRSRTSWTGPPSPAATVSPSAVGRSVGRSLSAGHDVGIWRSSCVLVFFVPPAPSPPLNCRRMKNGATVGAVTADRFGTTPSTTTTATTTAPPWNTAAVAAAAELPARSAFRPTADSADSAAAAVADRAVPESFRHRLKAKKKQTNKRRTAR